MKNISIIIVSLLIGMSSMAQVDRSKAPEPGPAPEINIADPKVFTLDNGMKVILSSNHDQPKVSFNLVMGSDPRLEGNKAGLSELAGDLLSSGTTNRSKDQLDKEKDYIGASLFASSSSIYMSCLTKHMDKGLDLMTDVMKNASFPQDEFDRIKKQYESNLLSVKTDPNSMANNAMSKAIFPEDHPYGEIMTEKTLENITREDVVNFYKKQFTPAGSYLVIVGDIDESKAKELAEANFGDWAGTVPFEKSYGKGYVPAGNRVIFVEKPGAVQSVINIAFPIDMKPGDEDQIKLSVLNKLFGGGGFGTRLMQNLREDKAYTYGAYSRTNINREGSWLSASGSFRNEVTDSAITQFLYEFDRITKDMVTDEELELNKSSLSGSFARSLESPRTVANFALNIFRNDLPSDYYQAYLKKLSAVNKEDVLQTAKTYFKPQNLNIIVVGNPDVLEKLKQFDADGKIEIFDAFGNKSKKKEYRKTDMTAAKVFDNYLLAVTGQSKMKKANKILSKVNSLKKVMDVTPAGAPVTLTMESYYMAPNKEMTLLEFQGMEIQKKVFNGEMGVTIAINESRGKDTTLLSNEEIEDQKAMTGFLPEMGLRKNLDRVTLLGLDSLSGKEYYVIEYVEGSTTTKAYYNTETLMKEHSASIEVTDDGANEISATFSEFEQYKKIFFPKKTVQLVGSQSMTATLKEIVINKDVDSSIFELK